VKIDQFDILNFIHCRREEKATQSTKETAGRDG